MYITFTYTHRFLLLPLKAIFAYWCSWPMESTFETFGFSRVNCFESLSKHRMIQNDRTFPVAFLWGSFATWSLSHTRKGKFPIEVILSLHGTKAPELHPREICNDFHFLTAFSLVVVYIHFHCSYWLCTPWGGSNYMARQHHTCAFLEAFWPHKVRGWLMDDAMVMD